MPVENRKPIVAKNFAGDEGKPFCTRCINFGADCEYIDDQSFKAPSSKPVSPHRVFEGATLENFLTSHDTEAPAE